MDERLIQFWGNEKRDDSPRIGIDQEKENEGIVDER